MSISAEQRALDEKAVERVGSVRFRADFDRRPNGGVDQIVAYAAPVRRGDTATWCFMATPQDDVRTFYTERALNALPAYIAALAEAEAEVARLKAENDAMRNALTITKASFKIRQTKGSGIRYGGDKMTISQEAVFAIEDALKGAAHD